MEARITARRPGNTDVIFGYGKAVADSVTNAMEQLFSTVHYLTPNYMQCPAMTDPTTRRGIARICGSNFGGCCALRSGVESCSTSSCMVTRTPSFKPSRGLCPRLRSGSPTRMKFSRMFGSSFDTNFRRETADPSVRSDGSPLEIGDEYFNTVELVKRVWNGAIWYTPNADGQAIQLALANPMTQPKASGWSPTNGQR